MHPTRAPLLLLTLLLGGCAAPAHQQLGAALSGLEGELQRLEEELAAMNGLHYQKAIDAPLSLRRRLSAPVPTAQGLLPSHSTLTDGPLLRYDYRLPVDMASLPLTEPCLRYEFELGRLGQLALHWQGAAGSGEQLIQQRDCPFSANGPGLQ
ncbi:hypothetical protein RYR53_003022 [Aeromonas hydrophila]|nr:hypothetical protein [Aeromonas hydrophila]